MPILLSLENKDLEAFQASISWLYTRRLSDAAEDSALTQMMLCRIWVLGDSRAIPGLKNAAMDAFARKLLGNWVSPGRRVINFIYDNSVEDAAFRRFLVDFVVHTSGFTQTRILEERWKKTCKAGLHAEFVADMMVSLLAHGRLAVPWKKEEPGALRIDICEYHDHADVYEGANT